MTFDEYERQQMLWHNEESARAFRDCTEGLPEYPPNWPYGSGPHSMQYLAMIWSLEHPARILEIGFNLGRSAAIWLWLGVRRVVSVDIRDCPVMWQAAAVLASRYPERFNLLTCAACQVDEKVRGLSEKFDAIFIDGSHEYECVKADIQLARHLGIRRMIFDDCHPHWGPGVQQAIMEAGLKIHAIFGTIAYCEDINADDWIKPCQKPQNTES